MRRTSACQNLVQMRILFKSRKGSRRPFAEWTQKRWMGNVEPGSRIKRRPGALMKEAGETVLFLLDDQKKKEQNAPTRRE